MRNGKVFDHLRKLQSEKLIKFWGASVETSEEALVCLEQEGLASLQIIFNLFRQHVQMKYSPKQRKRMLPLLSRAACKWFARQLNSMSNKICFD
jgi:aryl-alcohol dehydrogenase-like predicted oxidoreductase